MKRRKWLMILLFLYILPTLTGCRTGSNEETKKPLCRVVTQVCVTYDNGPIHAQRCYTDSRRMEMVLHYLRFIDPYGTPQVAPEQTGGSDFYIVLSYSDGSEKVYHQHADRYMQVDGGRWKMIDPNKAMELSRLLCAMENCGDET